MVRKVAVVPSLRDVIRRRILNASDHCKNSRMCDQGSVDCE